MLNNIETQLISAAGKKIILGGDFNIDFNSNCNMSDILKDFLNEYHLNITDELIVGNNDDLYTFRVIKSNNYSFIDHFAVSDNLYNNIIECNINDSGANFSDHCSICLNVNIDFNVSTVNNNCINNCNKPKAVHNSSYRWDKGDMQNYVIYCKALFDKIVIPYYLTDANSKQLFSAVHIKTVIDEFYQCIVYALLQASSAFIPVRKSNFYKFWWDEELENLKDASIKDFKIWSDAGKPRSGVIFQNMYRSKMQYKACINMKKASSNNAFSNDLSEALHEKNMTTFWKSWRSKFNKNTIANNIEGETDPSVIADKFANFFKSVCVPNKADVNEKIKSDFYNLMENYQGATMNFNLINVNLVNFCINNLKLGKAAGIDKITAEHLYYTHPYISDLLSVLFKCCLIHGIVPNSFGTSIIIPLVKDTSGDVTKTSNYRGIALSPIISKVFESCLLNIFNEQLQSSNLQFGFKKNSGCRNAILTLHSVVKYYTKHNSTVSLCALDISKAFDRINYYALLKLLMKRMLPSNFIKVLLHWFTISQSCVRWLNAYSDCFDILAGVRQGGVLSPTLFAIYIDVLIENLTNSKLGCSIYKMYVGCLVYADDIVLLSTSVCDLQSMLKICDQYASDYDLNFNATKSVAMRIGPRYRINCPTLMLTGKPLQSVNEFKYLGVNIKSGKKFDVNFDILKSKFYRTFNAIYSKSKASNSELISLQLLQSYCMPIILYSVEALHISNATMKSMDNVVNNAIGKIFATYDKNNIANVRTYCNVPYLAEICNNRKSCFFRSLLGNCFIDLYRSTVFDVGNY